MARAAASSSTASAAVREATAPRVRSPARSPPRVRSPARLPKPPPVPKEHLLPKPPPLPGAVKADKAQPAAGTAAQAGAGGASTASTSSAVAVKEGSPAPLPPLWPLAVLVPIKNILSLYLLVPVVLGECKSERTCLPLANALFLVADVVTFSSHLFLGFKQKGYRELAPTYNFYILLVFWSVWNFFSHPMCRQHVVDLFVAPPEIHVMINIGAIAVCSSTIMSPPSMRHLIGLVTCEFLISVILSSIEVLNFSLDGGWLTAVRLDIVMFNIAVLLIGSTIILGTMTVEKDIKTLAQEMESRLGPAGLFEDDLERRKRAVLTALCDAVLTTDASFKVIGSDDGADRVFRRAMLNELLTDYIKGSEEKDRFMMAVKRQFPEDDAVGEGPKRMRVQFRDDSDETFEADVVVSDASTGKSGKVNKYMVGMHVRGEFRSRALEDSSKRGSRAMPDRLPATTKEGQVEREKEKRSDARDSAGDDRTSQIQMYEELGRGILASFEDALRPISEAAPAAGKGSAPPAAQAPLPAHLPQSQPFFLRRASCEVFRRRANLSLGSRVGEGRHVDLRRLSLPEPAVAGLT